MTTLRDALSEAIGKSEQPINETPTEVKTDTPVETPVEAAAETAEQREERLRDEKGRFARSQEKPETPQATQAPVQARKPPSSWKKDYWSHWERLGTDPELSKLQDYIEQREQDFAKGVSTYKGQWEQAQPLYEAVAPFSQDFQRFGVQPAQLVGNLLNAHRTLALGGPEQKLQAFAKLAADYGVPLQALQGGQVDPQQSHVLQTVGSLQRQLQELQQNRQQEQQSALQQQIEAFAKDAPHFEAVKQTMAGLLQSGVASDLKTAYDKALRLHDDLWQQEQARQAEEARKTREAELAKKKAAAVSPRSSSPTGAMSQGNAKKGLRDTLSEAVDSVAGGRF